MRARNESTDGKSRVLYQKLGDRWYIITDTQQGLYYTVVPKGLDPRTDKIELIQEVADQLERTEKEKPRPLRKIMESTPC